MRISDWSSDVCSSDLRIAPHEGGAFPDNPCCACRGRRCFGPDAEGRTARADRRQAPVAGRAGAQCGTCTRGEGCASGRSEEHTSELQSLMRNSYAVFCLKKKQKNESNNMN